MVVIKIWLELPEIEFGEKISKFFTCERLSLLSTLQVLLKAFCKSQKLLKIQFFESQSLLLMVLGGRSGIRNGLVWPQMISQIAVIDILHM